MNCSKCYMQNEPDANFCKSCGTPMGMESLSKPDDMTSDILLLVFIAVTVVIHAAIFIFQRFNPRWYEGPERYFQGLLWIILNLSYVLVPLSIKNKNIKIVGLILTSVIVLYWMFTNLKFMFDSPPQF